MQFLKNYIYFYPIFANIVTCEKKILDIYIFFIIFWLDICTENSKQNGVRFACFFIDTVLFSLLGVYVCSLDGVCNASLLIVSHLQTFHQLSTKLVSYCIMATIRATVYNKYASIIFTMHEKLNDLNFFVEMIFSLLIL